MAIESVAHEPTYTLIERDGYDDVVNTITGLVRARAELVANTMRIGTAYQGDRPYTVEIVRELTPAEQAQEAAQRWRSADHASLHKVSHMVQALREVADELDRLGELEALSTILRVSIQVCGGHARPAGEAIAAVDAIAEALGLTASRGPMVDGIPGHYSTGGGKNLIVVTTALDEIEGVERSEVKPKPLVISDETIRQAEQLGRMVAAKDLALPSAPCGCPIKGDEDATFVDHCQACIDEQVSA